MTGEVLTIQFNDDERLLIPGQGVAVRGQLLEIGEGRTGQAFPYRSPRAQVQHYGEQHYVLVKYEDEYGRALDHPDLDVIIDKSRPAFIEARDAAEEPEGTHAKMRELSEMAPRRSKRTDVIERGIEDSDRPRKKKKLKSRSRE